MKVLSLFDGISCGMQALERAGIPVESYTACEIDKHAIKVSKRHYPSIIQGGSVTEFSAKEGEYDLVIGGSPCQSFSRAGDGSGFDGKSGLFWEYVRILKEAKPKYFLLENVMMKKEWQDIITEALGVEPVLIDSKLMTAQKRQRMYWANFPITQPEDRGITLMDLPERDRDVINNHPVVLSTADRMVVVRNATKRGYDIALHGDSVNLEVPNSKTRRGRVGDGKTNTLNTACNYGMNLNGNLVALTVEDCETLQGMTQGYTEGISLNQRKKAIGNGWTVPVIAHIFKGMQSNLLIDILDLDGVENVLGK